MGLVLCLEFAFWTPVVKFDENTDYAPNFEKVGGAYCFWLVRSFVTVFLCLL